MEEFKGTRGEWQVAKTGTEKAAIWVGGSRIAVIDEFPHIGSEANANLISASPELLKAIQNLLYLFRPYATSFSDDIAISESELAINKALGR